MFQPQPNMPQQTKVFVFGKMLRNQVRLLQLMSSHIQPYCGVKHLGSRDMQLIMANRTKLQALATHQRAQRTHTMLVSTTYQLEQLHHIYQLLTQTYWHIQHRPVFYRHTTLSLSVRVAYTTTTTGFYKTWQLKLTRLVSIDLCSLLVAPMDNNVPALLFIFDVVEKLNANSESTESWSKRLANLIWILFALRVMRWMRTFPMLRQHQRFLSDPYAYKRLVNTGNPGLADQKKSLKTRFKS